MPLTKAAAAGPAFKTLSTHSRISRKSYIAGEDEECLFLYSAEDVRNFLYAVEKYQLVNYTILSFKFDGQKTFVIHVECPKDQYADCADALDELFANISPTLLGCLNLSEVNLQRESIETMKEYLTNLERFSL